MFTHAVSVSFITHSVGLGCSGKALSSSRAAHFSGAWGRSRQCACALFQEPISHFIWTSDFF